ncbi:B12-binding domain-containing radical SAM protein [Telmatospirillum siberiense]|uniref:B12-binding domain-containing protein n=1 Tax=Telmatospirillum siberiense TaxID=382514 RepID=A0A2N3PVA1_9PROT|nr:radical SAM protein [Telmatospirillum siberiense]PKU24333.1 hypothetical protein CWS72_12120 [Telmatospirillum siberiense]
MRLSLVQLYSEEQSPTSAPYSIEVLAGYIRKTLPEWDVALFILDNRDPADIGKLVGDLGARGSDVIGISMMQGTHSVGCALLDRLYTQTAAERHLPQIVVGNTLPTYRPEIYLDRYPGLLVVRSFGEIPLESALRQYAAWTEAGAPPPGPDFFLTPGIALRHDGRMHQTPVAWPRDYAVPTWVDPHKYFARVETSRGCHFDHCAFCTRPPREAGQPRWIRFPIDPIVETIAKLKDLGIRRFTFCDEDFIGDDPEFCLRLADRLEALHDTPTFSFSTRADNVVRLRDSDKANDRRLALLKRLQQVGLSLLFVGCESFCDRQLKRFAKATKAEGNIRALQLLEEIGLPVESGFIMFDPFASVDDLMENIENLDRHRLWRITSQTLSRIDVQEASALHKWVARADLLGSYDFDQMTYDYRFEDPLVQKIADWCQIWKNETDYAYRLARNAQRMALFDEFPNHVVEAAKELNFDFVKFLTLAMIEDPATVPPLVERMKERRAAVIDGMLEATQSPRVHADLADRLRREISGFIGVLNPRDPWQPQESAQEPTL